MADSAKPYTTWDIDCVLFDGENNDVTKVKAVHQLHIGNGQFIVRLTCDRDGREVSYEDRGTLDLSARIAGKTGYGGELSGEVLKDNFGNLLQGRGGDVEFIMGAIAVADDHNRCFRRLDVRKGPRFTARRSSPGRTTPRPTTASWQGRTRCQTS